MVNILLSAVGEEDWKLRVVWRREFWLLGFGKHFDVSGGNCSRTYARLKSLASTREQKQEQRNGGRFARCRRAMSRRR